MLSHEYDCLANIGTKELGQMSKCGESKQSEKNIWKNTHRNSLFVVDFGISVISRHGPHLMTVMIFVTQNNFKNDPGISDRLLGFY